jgi:hypothetical protein
MIWLAEGQNRSATKGIQRVRLCHRFSPSSARFDEPNLVSAAGLVAVVALAERVGLRVLTDARLTVPTDRGAHQASCAYDAITQPRSSVNQGLA